MPLRRKIVNYQGTGSARDRLQIRKSSPPPVHIRDIPTSEPKSHGCSQNLTGASERLIALVNGGLRVQLLLK
jgi:hypothetical protein